MNGPPNSNDRIEQLISDLEKIKAELKQEKELRKEIETNYELLNTHYEQALIFIQNAKRPNSSGDNGCFFSLFVLIIFVLILFYLMNINIIK